jgi:hypothetical protein
MRHYGIFNVKTQRWVCFDNGMLFWTTSFNAACAQRSASGLDPLQYTIEQFGE